jgi:hypothetical protein
MKLTIIPLENKISIDGQPLVECDVSWIPEFVGDITGVPQKVHAVQWYDDHGEIELVTRDSNIVITELGIFEQAITKYEERKAKISEEIELELLRIQEEHENLYELEELDIEQLLSEL